MIEADELRKTAHNRFRRLFHLTIHPRDGWRASRNLLFQCQEDALFCQADSIHDDHAMA